MRTLAITLLLLTVGQLAVATFVPGLPHFEDKAFGSRLVAYPVLMAAPGALVVRRPSARDDRVAAVGEASSSSQRPSAVTGLGAVLAVLWELAEWWTFIRHGTERAAAYTDTLGDEALGTLGAAVAGVVVTVHKPGASAGGGR